MISHGLKYNFRSSESTAQAPYYEEASDIKLSDAKKGILSGLAAIAVGGVCSSIYYVGDGQDAIVNNFVDGRHYVNDTGLHFTLPFITRVIIVDEHYLNTTFEGMLRDLEMFKNATEGNMGYYVKLKDNADLEREVERVAPYVSTNLKQDYSIRPPIGFGLLPDLIAGVYYLFTGNVLISDRYAEGGSDDEKPFVYHIVVHETTHANGCYDETTTEVVSAEVDAEVGLSGTKTYIPALYNWLERRIVNASYYRAKQEGKVDIWERKIIELYGEKELRRLEDKYFPGWTDRDFEEYAVQPYCRLKLGLAEGNRVYDLNGYPPRGQNFSTYPYPHYVSSESGAGEKYFLIDDLSKLWTKAKLEYGPRNGIFDFIDLSKIAPLQGMEQSSIKNLESKLFKD